MDIWQRARSFAEEAAKRSQELTLEAAKRSQEFTIGGSKFADIVSETAKMSKEIAAQATKRSQELTIGGSKFSDIVSETAKEIAAEASKRADQIKTEALKGADKIKSLAEGIAPAPALSKGESSSSEAASDDLDPERFGVTEDLREFVKEITVNTFLEFPLEDDSEISDVPTVSNVRQDLTQWQEKHAKLVLSSVKKISKLRYEICPRFMKERKFWRIYFLIVNTHVATYEQQYMEDLRKEKEVKTDSVSNTTSKYEVNSQIKSTTSASEQDLDVFLLGGLGDSDDGGPDDGDDGLDDDFDKMADSSEDEKEKHK